MVNYSQAKVYKIVDNTNGNIYIGSTCEPTLARRLAGHVTHYNRYLNCGKGSYYTSYQILENRNYDIILLETCNNVTTKDELMARERYYIETLTCVNKVIPLRTDKEYRIANKEKRAEQNKKWEEANKDKVIKRHKIYRDAHKVQKSETSKEYYEANKEAITEKSKEYYEANKEALIKKMKDYQEANKDKLRAYRKEYYAKRRQSKQEPVEATEQQLN
jgi:hypothetical protein